MPRIFGIGVDIVEIGRVAEMRRRQGERFHESLFLPGEREYCLARANADECFAARFAAKEAVMKALGTGWGGGASFTGIEVARTGESRPEVRLHGGTAELARELGVGKIHLSLSHSRETAVAYAVAEAAE